MIKSLPLVIGAACIAVGVMIGRQTVFNDITMVDEPMCKEVIVNQYLDKWEVNHESTNRDIGVGQDQVLTGTN